jgi:hypothetical protein
VNCRICASSSTEVFSATILRKYRIRYYHCSTCGFLQTEDPYWLAEAYEHPINASDCGLLARNNRFAKLTAPLLYCAFDRRARYLDYAGGYGILTRLMRDVGFDYYWTDPYAKNLFAKGFEFDRRLLPIELITAFEVFEHLADPCAELDRMTAISRNIFFSTLLLPEPLAKPEDWWYYGTEHGQHIAFYSLKTLQFLGRKYHTNVVTNGVDVHLFTTKRIHPLFFRHLPLLSKYGLSQLVHRRMQSRTVQDMNAIIAELQS